MKNVVLCGPVPAPVGGVSIHISRLANKLEKLGYGVAYIDEAPQRKEGIFNLRSFNLYAYLKLIAAADIVHIHSSIKLFLLLHLLVARALAKPTLITLHSWRESTFRTRLWRLIFKLLKTRLIYVSEEIRAKIDLPGPVIAAYVHPDLDNEPVLPAGLEHFLITSKEKGKKICVSNAYRLVDHQGHCLYGLDMCLEAFKYFSEQQVDDVVMIYVVANCDSSFEKLQAYQRFIIDNGLQERFLLFEGALSFARLLMEADMSVRATNTDGDALSVRESLSLGCVTIASDCVKRPNNTLLFKTRCHDDMVSVILHALESIRSTSTNAKIPLEDCMGEIVQQYRRM